MTNAGTLIDEKYEILKEIGRGGMSVVYLAMDRRLHKTWAIKEICKSGSGKQEEIVMNSLLAEADMMKRLDHPALPRIVDIIDTGDTIYVVMDYIEGESLDKRLKEQGAQPEELVIRWAKQLCEALGYLHTQKPPIIYRDMKPANIMLTPEGMIKIIDFGIAREYKAENFADTTVLGTKGYAPPEQYSGQTDARSDIFALGMTLHQMLTGVDPRGGEGYAPVRQWNPELSEGVECIIDKCVAPLPENRYQSCAELRYDLEHPEGITRGFKKKQKRKVRVFLLSASLCAFLLITGITCRALSIHLNHNTYDSLLSVISSTALPEKIGRYTKAIAIYPYDTRAYMAILEAYETEGHFGKTENDRFLALYNAHKSGFDPTTDGFSELHYKAGMMYFHYYTKEAGTGCFSERVQKAYPFFAANANNTERSPNFPSQSLSDCYYQICSFYKKYILSSIPVEEASKDDYEALFQVLYETLEAVKEAGAYDRLSLYNGVMMLLYDQRASLSSVRVEQESVLELFDAVCSRAEELVVQKEQSKRLQQEITEKYETYREAIVRAYINREERG